MEPSDTSSSAARAQIELLRRATNQQRFARMRSLSTMVIELSRRALRRQHPDWSELQVQLEWVRVNYGDEIATKLRAYLEQRSAT